MSRIQQFHAMTLIALLTTVVAFAVTIHPPAADASRPVAAQGPGGATSIDSARLAPRPDLDPSKFFGGWWKTFKKVFRLIIEFIDGIIDTTTELLTQSAVETPRARPSALPFTPNRVA